MGEAWGIVSMSIDKDCGLFTFYLAPRRGSRCGSWLAGVPLRSTPT